MDMDSVLGGLDLHGGYIWRNWFCSFILYVIVCGLAAAA